MAPTLEWQEIAWRLVVTVIAGALLGINRSERGRAAGLRTTLLVCIAAAVTMIQVNLLLPTAGREPDSFAQFDVLRLPLGLLTGMGFIGAGAIVKRGDLVQGVTTAATLWLATIIGLCCGGGQIALAVAALALGIGTLWGLNWLELQIHQDHRATLTLVAGLECHADDEIRSALLAAGYRIASRQVAYRTKGKIHRRSVRFDIRWHGRQVDVEPPGFLHELGQRAGVVRLEWRM